MEEMPVRALFSALLLLALSARPAPAAPQWHELPNAPHVERIDGMHFIDTRTGWVGTSNGSIHRTDDGGDTWTQQYWDPALYVRCITFADSQRGYAGMLSSSHTLFLSEDGGTTWSLVTNVPDPKPNALCGVWAPSSLVAYGVGSYSGPARVIKTIDGGKTWTSKDLAPQATTLVDVYFRDDRNGFIVGGIGATFPTQTRAVVLQTSDGGTTWQTRFTGTRTGEWGWKISFPTPQIGYVSLERMNGPMFFLKTTNGGATWTDMPFVNFNEQGFGFATPLIGWVGGWQNPTYGTVDGGVTWTQTPFGQYLDRFQFLTPSYGFASGVTVYRYADETVGVPEPGPAASLRALPNPFGARTTIEYVLADPTTVELLIADPAGRIVRRLHDGMQPAGPYRVQWDGKDDAGRELPAGIYLYVLHAGERHEMGKLVRVR
jgi:photosystem II stability/assembly factor-like uncharacterized protein